jgi:hypothetical protein
VNIEQQRKHTDSRYLVFIGAIIFILMGAWSGGLQESGRDFKATYLASHSLVSGLGDPYNENSMAVVGATSEPAFTRFLYFPTMFAVTAPLGLLSWKAAATVWLVFTIGLIIVAAVLIWNVGEGYSPLLASVLVAYFLVNSEVVLIMTNAAGIAIALCVISCWSFVKGKYIWLGVICLALSLMIKPQDTGAIWLFFLLIGGSYRKNTLRTLAVIILLGIPSLLWVWHISPHWLQEWHNNVAWFSAKGRINDPGGIGLLVNLQAPFSAIRDVPNFYNTATILVMAPVFALWGWLTLKSKLTPRSVWIGLAATSSLALLPVYHHLFDAKILLLTIPACAMLWAEGKRFIPILTILAFVFTGDVYVSQLACRGGILGWIATPLLLLMGVSYLVAWTKPCSVHMESCQTAP